MLRLILLLLIYPFPSHGCGSNGNFDKEKLLAEQNSLYLFDFLDNSRDQSAAYRTHVHEQINNVNRDMDNYFYSFFIVGRQVPCDNRVQSLHRVVKRTDALRFFFVMVGSGTLKSIKDNQDVYQKEKLTIMSDHDKKFVDEINKEKKYKYCVTTQKMTKQVAESRVKTLTLLFNFVFNNRKKHGYQLYMDINYNNECITKEQTLTSASSKFPKIGSEPFKFLVQDFRGFEQSGFADIAVTRPSSGKEKTFVILSAGRMTDPNRYDIVKYDGPVVFGEGETKATISLEVKTNSYIKESKPLEVHLENDEFAKIEIKNVEPQKPVCYIGGGREINRYRPSLVPMDDMPIYSLPTTEDDSLPWNQRCNVETIAEYKPDNVLQEVRELERGDKEKKQLARAAMEILDAVYWMSDPEKKKKSCFNMMMYTVAIALVMDGDRPTIYLAGNLDFTRMESPSNWVGFLGSKTSENEQIKEAISYILRKRNLIPSLYSDINVLINPGPTHMGRHAEMQLTSYAFRTPNLVIENIGVSKTPCCMCNTVLNSQNLHQQIPARQHENDKNDKYLADAHGNGQAFGSHLGVYSGPGKDLCTTSKGPWCGSQYGALKKIKNNEKNYLGSGSIFANNLKSWKHPNHRSMNLKKETWVWPEQSERGHIAGA